MVSNKLTTQVCLYSWQGDDKESIEKWTYNILTIFLHKTIDFV